MLKKCPFRICVDSREQLPFSFVGLSMPIKGKTQEVEVETVETCLGNDGGDYMVEGIDDVRIERKGLADAYSSIGNRDAFKTQIEYMHFAFRFSAVVIEASWAEVCNPLLFDPFWKSKLHPQSVIQSIASWSIRYPRVHWLAPGSRREAEVATFDLLRQAHRHSVESAK